MTVLVISASVGAGHVRAAQALAEAARAEQPGPVVHWDILEFTSRTYRRAYADSYIRLVQRSPALWGYLYALADRSAQRREQAKLVQLFDRLQFARFRAELRALAPDVVIATHFLPCQVLAPDRSRGRDRFPLGLVLTDFDAHAMWVQPTADRFFVGSDELAAILAGRGIEPALIRVTGIPIGQAFARRMPQGAARRAFGIDESSPTVLVMGGGHGTGAVADAVRAALDLSDAHVLAVAGRNRALRETLHAIDGDGRLHVFGFVDRIESLMSAADLVVTKSGGLTTAECLALGVPMLVLDPTPGQEERNCDRLLEIGAAWRAHGPASLRHKLGRLLSEPARCRAMGRAAKQHGRPAAAREVVREMFALGSARVAE